MELARCDLIGYLIEFDDFKNQEVRIVHHITIMKQLAKGIVYLMENNVIHRDIKPENILYFEENDIFRITDFGTCKKLSETPITPFPRGTLYFSDPSVRIDVSEQGIESDIFSFGVVIYFICELRYPWKKEMPTMDD